MTNPFASSTPTNELDEIPTGELSPIENQQLRRIIREHQNARYMRARIGWWLMFGLGLPTVFLAIENLFRGMLDMLILHK